MKGCFVSTSVSFSPLTCSHGYRRGKERYHPFQSFLSVMVCKNRISSRTFIMNIVEGHAVTDGVGTNGSMLSFSGMTCNISCCGKSVLQILAQIKAILSWCGDSGNTTARSIVGDVGGVTSMSQTVDTLDFNAIFIFNNLCTLTCS